MTNEEELNEYKKKLDEYRSAILQAEQKAQESYDKTVLTLSGGALGVSLTFIDKIVGREGVRTAPGYLLGAWICWGFSMAFVLASFYFSQRALRKTVEQIDAGTLEKERPGGCWTCFTLTLNALGGLGFIVGLILMIIFIGRKL